MGLPSNLIAGLSGGGPPLRFATQQNRCGTSIASSGANIRRQISAHAIYAASGAWKYWRLLFGNFYWPVASQTVIASGGDFTILSAKICRYQSGTVKPITFGGAAGVTVPSGGIVLSDPILPSLFSLTEFPVNAVEYLVTSEIEMAPGGALPLVEGTDDGLGAQGYFYNPAVTTWNNPTSNDTPTFIGTAPTANFGVSQIMVGEFTAAAIASGEPRVYGITGDSIFANGSLTSYGIRALSKTPFLAGCQMGRPGGSCIAFNSPLALPLLKYCNTVVDEFGTNDVALGLAGMQSEQLAYWARLVLGANVITTTPFKILRPGLLLSTTGVNTTTLGAQTPSSGWGSGETVEQFNAWLATQVGIGNGPAAYVDVSAPVRGSASIGDPDYYKWISGVCGDPGPAPGSSPAFLHPNSTGANLLRDPLRAAMDLL